ncbi:S9 family peptidase [Gilvimarinus chinensis]|uniref:S9 family peptidase n=1 Tax=Gilvimarinus chinensis TaxID=396005 RepID=UPI00036FE361|nr:prolyl oligopeptidase family serine peptidase [Gilvimarinus chinensis]
MGSVQGPEIHKPVESMSAKNTKHIAPFGTWNSPITPEALTANSLRLDAPQLCGAIVYWLESRPDEGGRNVLMRQELGKDPRELLDASVSVRTRANEYGGGAYLATENAVFAVFDADQRIYKIPLRQGHSLTPVAITPEGDYRYADFCFDAKRERLIAVREDHTGEGEEIAQLVAIDINANYKVTTLAEGADFYSNPRLSPDGRELLWLSWQHPNMPWDGTELSLAKLSEKGEIENHQVIAGSATESIFQPSWSPEGTLYYVNDRSNWWNLYCYEGGKHLCVIEREAEFATPQWVFGMSTYGFISDDKIICCYSENGLWSLGLITRKKTARGYQFSALASPLTDISNIQANADHIVFTGGNAERSSTLFHFLSQSIGHKAAPPMQQLRRSKPASFEPDDLAKPQAISFATSGNASCHGFYYAPTNAKFTAPEGEKPPLIVMCHGGPTGATSSALNEKLQFWTSRGFAVLDVNYRGSTGYGRDYRDSLKGNWGVADVADVAAGAQYLADQGLADSSKLIIRGSSAGGYTVLAALTFTDTFSLGASLYGIGDLSALAEHTHKFESRYLDTLVGPYPEAKAVYTERSPIHHIEQLSCPVIFLQGLKDKVVPPEQAEAMVAALEQKGIANRYVTFADEAHGFRSAEAIQTAAREELAFYQQQLNLGSA